MILGRMQCVVAGALLAVSVITSASAEVRIQRDFGGQIGPYLYKYAMIREAGHRVVIDGPCLSACTLALAVIPRERICMTPNAVLGFHAAWMPGADGQPVRSTGGPGRLMAAHPPRVRDWIKRRGGLHSRTIFLRGRELSALYPSCS